MQHDQFSTIARSRPEVDAGLRSHMNSIYMRMSAGVLVTALVAYAVGTVPALYNILMGGPQSLIFALAPLAIVFLGFNPARMSSSTLQLSFFALSACYGVSFSVIAVMATANLDFVYDLARAFFITVGMFAGLSLVGYTTKKDLSGIANFCVMGMWGLIIMGLLSLFIDMNGFSMLFSLVTIIVFSGLTAYETQMMKEMYSPNTDKEISSRMAWASALNLYISFVAIFQSILSLFMNNND